MTLLRALPDRFRSTATGYLARMAFRRMQPVSASGPLLALGFDDVPQSTARIGAELLSAHGAKATFYVSAGLTRTDTGWPCATHEDLVALVGGGHEIGCHGYAHIDYRKHSRTAIRADIDANARAFEAMGLRPARNFAYPFGRIAPRGKALCGAHFDSCRGVQPGLLQGEADLALLPAAPFYQGTAQDALQLVDRLAREGGAAMLFSHAVTPSPSPYDCTPKQLETLLNRCAEHGVSVVTTAELVKRCFPDRSRRP